MFCNSCGYNLNGNENFCPSCGSKSGSKSVPEKMLITHEFSSNILLGGNILTPDKLIITEESVTYKKRNKYLIGEDSTTISLKNVSSVEIDRNLIDSHIKISSYGGGDILAQDFSIGDANKIKKIIEERI